MKRRIKIVLTIILLFISAEVNATKRANKQWIDRFASEPAQAFLRSLRTLPAQKKSNFGEQNNKRDEPTPKYESIVETEVLEFPMSEQTKQMMFALFGDDGLFTKDNFERSGQINIEGSALLSVWKIFSNKSILLEEIQSSKNATIGSSVFSVLTQVLFVPKDVSKLEEWLKEGIELGDEENDIACSPKVLINYKCCEATGEPLLAPEFGSIEMGVD